MLKNHNILWYAITSVAVASIIVAVQTVLNLSSEKIELVNVCGLVTVDGEPAMNVHVAFHPLQNGSTLCPVGRTDSNGYFQLTTSSGSFGAPEGIYRVTFLWPNANVEIDECENPDPLLHDQLHGLYSNNELGDQVDVRAPSSSFDFSLWKPTADTIFQGSDVGPKKTDGALPQVFRGSDDL